MSTPAGIRVVVNEGGPEQDKQVADLYRHCDGYPGEVGADIIEALKQEEDCRPERFLSYLLGATYDKASYQDRERHIYEIMSNVRYCGPLHFYVVWFRRGGKKGVTFTYYERGRDDPPDFFEWSRREELDSLVDLVNEDRKAMNKRLAELREEQPKGPWADADDYPMVEAA
jgi:hypothetical protein